MLASAKSSLSCFNFSLSHLLYFPTVISHLASPRHLSLSQKSDHSAYLSALNASLAHTRTELAAVAAAQRQIAQQLTAMNAASTSASSASASASGGSGSVSVQAAVAAELAAERESLRAWVKEQVRLLSLYISVMPSNFVRRIWSLCSHSHHLQSYTHLLIHSSLAFLFHLVLSLPPSLPPSLSCLLLSPPPVTLALSAPTAASADRVGHRVHAQRSLARDRLRVALVGRRDRGAQCDVPPPRDDVFGACGRAPV